jgi:hypothetical protein
MSRSFSTQWVADAHLTIINQAWGAVTNLTDALQNAMVTAHEKAVIAEREAQAKQYKSRTHDRQRDTLYNRHMGCLR